MLPSTPSISLLVLLSVLAPCAIAVPNLNIIWFSWDPCDTILHAAVSDYTAANVTIDCIPISDWYSTCK